MIPIARPLIGAEEKAAVMSVLESGQLAQGNCVAEFERRFAELCGVSDAVAVSSGTTALHVALLAHGLGPGDEVITVPFTFIASANSVLFTGARPVFTDIDPATYTMDVDHAASLITPRTKAILPVHLYGQPADLGPLLELAQHHGLALIEDAAQAHAARYGKRMVGSFGTGCFSFYPTKNMTSGEGGMVTTDDPELAARMRMLRQHGMNKQYYHEILGFNFRLTDLQATVGLAQIDKLSAWTTVRQANAAYYDAHLPAGVAPVVRPGRTHVYHQYTIRVPGDRDRAVELLAERGVQARIYYPLCIHQQPFYRQLGYRDYLPHAEGATEVVLSLPVHPSLTEEERAHVACAVNEAIKLL
ncbi:MAG: DegT/DnrJ/EryC1/StrS family aminotransferase [Chloroflexales bacterium]|nr:DegT/DnrJ/EryC1/StrS family aminotransferase [Chloroflexales bacterium]